MVNLDEIIQILKNEKLSSGLGSELARMVKNDPSLDLERYINEIIPLLTDDKDKLDAITGIFPHIQEQPLDIEQVVEKLIIPISDNNVRAYLMLYWMMEPDHLEIKKELIEAINTGKSPQHSSVKKMYDLLEDKQVQLFIRAGWASNSEAKYNIKDLTAFSHELSEHPHAKEKILKRWYVNQLKNPDNLLDQLNNIENPALKQETAKTAAGTLISESVENNELFNKLIYLIENTNEKTSLIYGYISYLYFNLKEINKDLYIRYLPLFNDKPEEQIALIKMWHDRNKDKHGELNKLMALIQDSAYKKKFMIQLIPEEIRKYFHETPDDKIDIKHALKLLSKIERMKDKISLVKEHRQLINARFDELLDTIFTEKLSSLDHPYLVEIIDSREKSFSAEMLCMALERSKDKYAQSVIIDKWLSGSPDLSTAQYSKILTLVPNDYVDLFNSNILSACGANLEKKFEIFTIITKKMPFEVLYNSLRMYYKFKEEFNTRNELEHKFIISLCQQLYPGAEYAQIELFKEALKDSNISPNQKTILLKEFASGLSEDDSCIDIIEYALSIEVNITPMDMLELSKTRISSRFESLRQVLDGITLDEAIRPDQWPELKNMFGDTLSKDSTLLGVFAYYDLNNNFGEFHKLLNESIQEQIKRSYQPPTHMAFIMPKERDKLIKLNIMAHDANDLPKMIPLCHYLKRREKTFMKIPPLEESLKNIAMISHANKDDTSPEMEYKRKFLALMSKLDTAKSSEIIGFFKEITGLDLIGQEDKLTDLLQKRSKELAFLFSKPNGITDYLAIIYTIGEGCGANIGTKTNMYILGKLFKDPIDKIVFPFYCEKIFNAIANLGGDILGSNITGSDIFSNPTVINSYLSPRGLVEGLADELKQSPKILNELLDKLLTRSENDNYMNNIIDYDDTESKQARVASYLILREILPKEDWHNVHFDFIKHEVESIIKDQDNIELNPGL